MKNSISHRSGRGFTLIEMLTVIAIIGILVGLLIPTIAIVKKKARITQARSEAANLAGVICAYQQQNSIYPSSKASADTASSMAADLTFTNGNSEVIIILLDIDDSAAPTPVNPQHMRNPQRHVFLNAKMTGTTSGPGVGSDYNFRDPWGTPYAITLDLNYDNDCADPVQGIQHVPVMVWSFGPDKLPGTKDDVKSW
jgi:prepilin-type N-terminal cleavage/methylation domain-containing protein